MAIIALKAWYLQEYEPIPELEKRPPDMRLSKQSLLKSALRADFLEDSEEIKKSIWFQRYLQGETIEFYIEGSGGYAISNIDLTSHEIYFTKQEVMAHLDPMLFFCYQQEEGESSQILKEALEETIADLNRRSRLTLTLESSHRPNQAPIRLNNPLMRRIRKSLLFIADGTPVTQVDTEEVTHLIPSPYVCVEMGYALQIKRPEQILLAQMERSEFPGQFPFDVSPQNRLSFQSAQDLKDILPTTLETLLERYRLLK
ncbi:MULTISPECIES: hypothetical protein [unclassified Roseofilum]|uniref:hypothetical protein n=1 Tax=unclassified Roseofilum TaxID=2620099 RepID=UPI000E886E0F|nr:MULTISPECIES: hypothetical protein [unclassified Roseofilum]MBP0009425.1 hypothetical protein [Roseofilum sp. Belize Diploria]MBP0031945.1 hypothetical protein [Roseofilum sp. Belize BBD 4]HBQ97915.1 hypothetical protein [Cyanobacteria bacterium UBA11691]